MRVDPNIFYEARDVKDIQLWPLPAHIDDRHGHLAWEHTEVIGETFDPQHLYSTMHAMYDVRVHAPGRATSVTMRVGALELSFERYECEFWVLKQFTRKRPLILLPLITNVTINVGGVQRPNIRSGLSFGCYHFKRDVVQLLSNDCFLDGPGPAQKTVFCDYLAFVDTRTDADWHDLTRL